jgi:hypothetical protein
MAVTASAIWALSSSVWVEKRGYSYSDDAVDEVDEEAMLISDGA